ncbi:MAG: HAD family phosphatase [Anaerolineaceae bacterium]|nr:HAD family phosphatase [Anaerolineaceae bacterium]
MNIIFDFGGVLFRWDPDLVIASQYSDEKTCRKVSDGLFGHQDWQEYDRGAISKEDLIKNVVERLNEPYEKIKALIDYVPETMQVIEGTAALLPKLKSQGHQLYALSNMPTITMAYLETHNGFFDLFSGMVISSRVKQIKPSTEIYETLLDTYELIPQETVFIDDTWVNLEAAADFGIIPHHFKNPEICERWLLEKGWL